MKIPMYEFAKRVSLLGLLAIGMSWLGGCSLMLDPDNCSSDGECGQGGVCQDGICIGGTPGAGGGGGEGGAGGSVPDMGPEPDMRVEVDMMPEPDMAVDMMPEPDMEPDMEVDAAPPPVAPECELTIDGELTNADTVQLNVVVSDADGAPRDLVVTINDMPVDVDADGFGTPELPIVMPDAENRFVLVATDQTDESCTAEARIISDQTAPSITMLDPAAEQTFLTNQPTFEVTGLVEDEHFAEALSVSIDGEPVDVESVWTLNGFSAELTVEPGVHTVAISTTDRAGNEGADVRFTVDLDTMPPTLQIASPDPNAITEARQRRLEVTGVLRDRGQPVRLAAVDIVVSSALGENRDYRANTRIDGSFSQFIELYDGQNTLSVCSSDEAGNPVCRSNIRVDKAVPCIDITAPTVDQFVGGDVIQVRGTICPSVERVTGYLLDAERPGQLINDTFMVLFQAPESGEYLVRIVAEDADGEAVEDTVIINVDSSPPVLNISSPENDSCVGGDVRICGQVRDVESGIAGLSIEAEVVEDIPADGIFCYSVEADEEGPQNIRVQATNGAGGTTLVSLNLTVDDSVPLIRFNQYDLANPLNPWLGVNGSDRVQIEGTVTSGACAVADFVFDLAGNCVVDEDCALGRVCVALADAQVDGNPALCRNNAQSPDCQRQCGVPISVDGDSRFSIQREFGDGQRSIEYLIRDHAGNERLGDFSFRVDSQPPSIVDFRAGEHAIVDEDVYFTADELIEVSAVIADVGSGIASAQINGNNTALNPVPGGDRIARGFFLVEGLNEMEISVTDRVGNNQTNEYAVVRDRTAPTVTVTSPQDGAEIVFPLIVSGTVADNEGGIGVAAVIVNGVAAEIDPETGTWIAADVQLDLDTLSMSVVATDRLGNRSEPNEVAVVVRPFGHRDPASEGLIGIGFVDDFKLMDLNRDGLADIVVSSAAGDPDGPPVEANRSWAAFIQNDAGSFDAFTAAEVGLPEGWPVRDSALGDVNGDGRVDLVAVGPDRTEVYLSDGQGGLERLQNSGLRTAADPTGLALGDINRDGILDVLVLGGADSFLYSGGADGRFGREDLGDLGLDGLEQYTRCTFVDVNADGDLDIVAVSDLGSALYLRNNQAGVFELNNEFAADAAVTAIPMDANRDGVLDLVTPAMGNPLVRVGDGNGGFTAEDLGLSWTFNEQGLVRIDFDLDTRDDILTYGFNGLGLNQGGVGGFSVVDPSGIGIDDPGYVTALTVLDMDADGDADIVLGGENGMRIIRSNAGNLTENGSPSLRVRGERRTAQGMGGEHRPADSVGALLYLQYVAELPEEPNNNPIVAERVIPLHPALHTIISVGDAAGVDAEMHFSEKLGNGQRIVELFGILPGSQTTVNARE